jgi:hypothetical protein
MNTKQLALTGSGRSANYRSSENHRLAAIFLLQPDHFKMPFEWQILILQNQQLQFEGLAQF